MARTITPAELVELHRHPLAFSLIDVSERGEYNLRHIDGASPVPRGDIEWRIGELIPDRGAPIVLYCSDGKRSRLAAGTLEGIGYKHVRYLEGGLDAWCKAGQQTIFGWGVRGKEYGEKVAVTQTLLQITPADLAAAQGRGERFLIVDSRTPGEYEQGHLPGAYSVPGGELPCQVMDLIGADERDRPAVVVNCAGRTRSILGAHLLSRMGIPKVAALKNGTLAWKEEGYPLETGTDPRRDYQPSGAAREAAARFAEQVQAEDRIKSVSSAQLRAMQQTSRLHYLIDVRLPDEYGAAHIPGAISCPLGQLSFYSEELVGIRGALVVMCSNRQVRATFAASLYLRMGFSQITVLEGGIEAWRASGLPLSQGASPRPIGRPERQVPGLEKAHPLSTVTADELARRLAGSGRPIVLDVRGIGDYALGHIAGSLWLSRSYLELRIGEQVPDRNREIVLADDDGIRGALAATTLKQTGYGRVAVLEGGVPGWRAAGKAMEEGLGAAPVSLEVARWDAVDPFQRRDALRFTSEEVKELMDWEIALGNKYHATTSPRQP